MRVPGPRSRRALRLIATVGVVGVVAALFAQTLASNWERVQQEQLAFDGRYLIAVVLFAVAVPLSGVLWGRIVNRLSPSARAGVVESTRVHMASWLLKYIPGQVGSLVNKVLWGQAKGISRTLIVITFVYENVFLQLASIVPGVAILLATVGFALFDDAVWVVVLPVLALAPLVVILDRRVFHWIVNFAGSRILKRPVPGDYFLASRRSLVFVVEFVAPRVLNGLGFVLLASAVLDIPPTMWLYVGAAYVLAGAVGILAVFVPSGLGVREAVVFACLVGAGFDPAQSVIVSIVARLLTTAADGIVALLYLASRPLDRKEPSA